MIVQCTSLMKLSQDYKIELERLAYNNSIYGMTNWDSCSFYVGYDLETGKYETVSMFPDISYYKTILHEWNQIDNWGIACDSSMGCKNSFDKHHV